jgi:hypothetical protein
MRILYLTVKPVFMLFLLCLSFAGYGQYKEHVNKDKSYRDGENLLYVVKFGPIVGGNATLVLKQEYFNNKLVFHARGEAKTVGLAEKLYSVKDIFESFFDQHTVLPYKSIRDVKEGNYRKHEEAIFNQAGNTVYCTRKDTTVNVPKNTLDMMSLLYYIRSIDLYEMKNGDVLRTITFFDEELFPFDIRFKGTEVIKTKYGKIRCYRFDPVVEPGRMFKSEDDMTIWISADRNLIPIKVKFNLVVGSLHMELSEYSNLKYPLGIIP